MEKVRKATEQTSTAAQKLEKQGQAFEKVGAGITTVGLAAAAAVAIAVKSFADFDAQMSQVQSLSHATASEMDTLRNAALTMGQGIGFSATQVAEAETELVKAGIGVKDIMGGALKGALDLAAAGQIDVAQATEIAATAMTQFGLSGKDIPHVADLLAAGADKSLGGVKELGDALKQSGLVAAQFGLSVDQTVGTLAEFASAGLMGSDAGTSLKQMFLQLATPSKQAAEAMKQYHISAYDAKGDFVGIAGLAGELQSGFKGVDAASRDAALGIIFGSDAIRAANILYKDGASGNEKWISSVDAAGFAAQQAAGKTDNLNGDVKKLGAALQTDLIKSGSASNDVLRSVTQNVTSLAKAFGDAPSGVQATALGLTAVVAATALAGGGFLSIVPKIAAARLAMQQMQLSAGKLVKGFAAGGAIALGLYAVTAAVAGLGKEAQLTDTQIAKLNASMTASNKKSLDQQFTGGGGMFDMIGTKVTNAKQALDSLTEGMGPVNVAAGKMFDNVAQTGMSDTATRFAAQFKQMGTVLSTTAESDIGSATKGFSRLVAEMGGGRDTAKRLLDQMDPYKAQLTELAGAQGKTLSETELLNLAQGKGKLAAQLAAESTQKQKEQLAQLSGVAAQASEDISALADSIRSFGSTQLSVEQTESDFQAAIDDATQALKDNGVQIDKNTGSIDLNSEKGRANAAALRQIASDGIAATAAIAENGGTQADAAAKMQNTRDAYIQAAQTFGLTKDQASKMADQLRLIPANVKTLFSGLVGGQTYSYVLGARNPETNTVGASTSVSIQVDSGTTWGPGSIEVLAVPSAPINGTALYTRFDSTHLSKWTAARAAVAAGTGNCKVLVIGDSTAFGYPSGSLQQSWSHKVAQRLVTRGLAAQDGGTTPGLSAGDNPRYTAGTGWPSGILYGFGAQGWQYNSPAGALQYADPFITADTFDVYFVRGSGATSITLQIDSETASTFDTTGTTSIGKISIASTTASTAHTLKITAVGTGAILFVEPWLSTSKRIRVANAGAPSTNSLTWANGVGIFSAAMIQAYQPNLVICLLGANDAVGGYTAKSVVQNIGVLAAAAASAGADFIDMSSVPCQILSEAALQQQYAIRTRYATSYPFIDMNQEAGTWVNWNSLGYMGDLRHPNEAGMERIATLVEAGLALV
ncbi:phage tail tape measure protein [Curtobacterium sp. ISL-83]|uniref:phage tail tape measure protein n=1 Tax=Curtobacterium sp. ISL-83 TaxID=2819145 RepID=UPI001BE6D799|nr:phage tail tape measure protein [Curtobacterium sp. ISL-83]MBT2501423.1 phage tail tape measure protein [Curtobacterium sp. ISL-83]